MTQDEARHAKKMEQIMASIDEKLERIATSLEKMEPVVYKVPRLDVPLEDVPDVKKALDDRHLRMIVAEEPAVEDEKIFKSNTPIYCWDLSNDFKP